MLLHCFSLVRWSPRCWVFWFAAALWGHAKQGRRVEVCCLFAMLAYAYMEVQPFHLTTNPTALLLCGAVFAQTSARWQKIE